jgi:hypothetical protein
MLGKFLTQIALCGVAAANLLPRQTEAPITPVARAEEAAPTSITVISDCHLHVSDLYVYTWEMLLW